MASMTMILIIGMVSFFNLAVILRKFEKGRTMDAVFDFGALVLIGFVFSGSISALSIGMIASFLFSIYLYFNEPKFMLKSSKKKKSIL